MVTLRPQIRSFSLPRRALRCVSVYLPPRNFITLHYAYFLGTCLLASVIIWGSATPPRSISFIDSLFFAISAMTLAGLNTVNLSELNTFQQFILFLLIMLGSAIFVSLTVVHIRRKAFERMFKSTVEDQRRQRKERGGSKQWLPFPASSPKRYQAGHQAEGPGVGENVTQPADQANKETPPVESTTPRLHSVVDQRRLSVGNESFLHGNSQDQGEEGGVAVSSTANEDESIPVDDSAARRITFTAPISHTRARQHSRVFSMQGVGARQDVLNYPSQTSLRIYPIGAVMEPQKKSEAPHSSLASYGTGFIGRNSQFSHLTVAERERLGGVEYRALSFLAVIVPLYFVLWQLLGCLGLGAYIARNKPKTTEENGLNPWWVGAFNAISAFNNSGMSLLDANMIPFQSSYYMLITMGLLILAGNTCYPIFLRLILWTIFQLLPDNEAFHDRRIALRFLLDHPRRCYTTLFPSSHTWWLLATLVCLNGTDWAAFEVLNIGNPTISSLPAGVRTIDGLFQAFAVRSGGFYVVAISELRIGLLILYVLMMYISVYPVVITMRNSNVYEERSLGIYADDPQEKSLEAKRSFLGGLKRRMTGRAGASGVRPESRSYFVRQQLRGQLAHDLWWIVLAVLFINIVETGQFERDPVAYSVFNVIFEVISAYGCVGISVGLPDAAYSFCGGWHTLSKLILCAVMIRGRHRGLPVAIDRAVLLPSEHLAAAEEEDAQIRLERTWSRGRSV